MFVTIYSCPLCKTRLSYDKAFLENGSITAICPKCKDHIILKRNPLCPLCFKPAEHMIVRYRETAADGTRVYGTELRCGLHEGCDDVQNNDNNIDQYKMILAYKCSGCKKTVRYSKATLTVVDGTLHAVCPLCNTETVLQQNVKCDYTNCTKPAAHCKPDKSMCSGHDFRCEEHKDIKVPKCFIATAACGSESAGDVVLLRKYRDTVLRNSVPGRRFIKMYESFSPPVARVIASSEFLKRAVRAVIVKPASRIAGKVLKNKEGAN